MTQAYSTASSEGLRGRVPAGGAALAAGVLVMACAPYARADEPMFGYLNTTDLLPAGKRQLEQWATLRSGDASGDYRLLESRTEFDYGVESNVQVTAYLNASRLEADIDGRAAAPARLAPAGSITRSRIDSATGEVIWRVWSPYLDPVGLAVLVDATGGRDPLVLGVKLIGQKNFRDDTVILAANLRADIGQQQDIATGGRREVTPIEIGLGASYRFRPNWSAAVELRGRRRYAGSFLGGGRREFAALYAGPTVHYGGQRWFMTLSLLHRLGARYADHRPGEVVSSLAYAADHADWDGARLRVGRTF